jgi:hypothetical protein
LDLMIFAKLKFFFDFLRELDFSNSKLHLV